jgi:hypothetical protein
LFFLYFSISLCTGDGGRAQGRDYLPARICIALGICIEMPDDLTTIVAEESA